MKRRTPHLPPGCVGFKDGCRLLGFSPATGQRRLTSDPQTKALPPVHRHCKRDRYFRLDELVAFKSGLAPEVLAMLATRRTDNHE